MNREELEKLGQNAKLFAETYVKVKEELVREGVREKEASETARRAAFIASMKPEDTGGLW